MKIALKAIWAAVFMAAMILPVAAQDNTATPAQDNTATPAPAPAQQPTQKQIDGAFRDRQERQQTRIEQGVKSGNLTGREAHHLERQHRRMNAEAAGMRAENGGTLTRADREKLNKQQNKESHRIRRAKANNQKK